MAARQKRVKIIPITKENNNNKYVCYFLCKSAPKSKHPKKKIKNPPPKEVVLSLPLKGDENASCPRRGRGVIPFVI